MVIDDFGITPYRVSKDIGVSRPTVLDILSGKRGISPLMAMKLGRYFGPSAEFWMNLQANYERWSILHDEARMKEINSIQPIAEVA